MQTLLLLYFGIFPVIFLIGALWAMRKHDLGAEVIFTFGVLGTGIVEVELIVLTFSSNESAKLMVKSGFLMVMVVLASHAVIRYVYNKLKRRSS
jgi:hypothetical protein